MTASNPQKPRILVIDDEPFFLQLIAQLLGDHYQVSLARNGQQGLQRARGAARPDLILLDIVMPQMDGYETCRQLKQDIDSHDIPVIFLTAKQAMEDELKAFDSGAVDFINKPINEPVLLSRVKTQLALSQQRLALEQLVQERTAELERTKDAIVYSMGAMAEARDNETGNHLLRTAAYVAALARQLAKTDEYRTRISEKYIDLCQRAAPLHDIGKISIPDSILRKPAALDADERIIMNRHPEYGKAIIDQAGLSIGATPFIQTAREIAWCHHEKWDGSGYPRGLQRDDIPLAARFMAIADVYDALVNERCYKKAMPHQQALEIISADSGRHFDPDIVQALQQAEKEFLTIYQTYQQP